MSDVYNMDYHLWHKFTQEIANWMSHRPLLWYALEQTTGPVLEMGMGIGSTELLHDYCKIRGRRLVSCDSSLDWMNHFTHLRSELHDIRHVADWDTLDVTGFSVVLVDHAPGERRWIDAIRVKDSDYVVIHDTETVSDGTRGYLMDRAFPHYAHRRDYKEYPAWATILSNRHAL
jgi:hypothetical protein